MRRRNAVKALVLLTLTGCGTGTGNVRVLALWNGWELTQFHRILSAFPGSGRWQVHVLSAGNDISALLSNRVARSASPDVALVQEPGVVRANRTRLVALRAPSAKPSGWERLLTFDGQVYGFWFKTAHKSLVWYRPDLLGTPPRTWDEWLHRCRVLADSGRPPLALGAADGWTLTDWFENVLLSVAPAVYHGLAAGQPSWRHPKVAESLHRLGAIWSIPGAFPGGRDRALVTQFDDALIDVFRHGHAPMVVGADFSYPTIKLTARGPSATFRFPAKAGEQEPLLVGGDAAVLLKPESRGGRELLEWLKTPEAAKIWAREGGFLSLDPAVQDYPSELSKLAEDVGKDAGQDVAFDLSDQLGGRLTGTDGHGTWEIFTQFFAAVAERPDAVNGAVQRAVDALDRAARGQG